MARIAGVGFCGDKVVEGPPDGVDGHRCDISGYTAGGGMHHELGRTDNRLDVGDAITNVVVYLIADADIAGLRDTQRSGTAGD